MYMNIIYMSIYLRIQALYAFQKAVIDILTSFLLDHNLVLSGTLQYPLSGWGLSSALVIQTASFGCHWSTLQKKVYKQPWSGVQKITFPFICKWQPHVFAVGFYVIEPCGILVHGMTQNVLWKKNPHFLPQQRSSLKEASNDSFMEGIYWQRSFPLQE